MFHDSTAQLFIGRMRDLQNQLRWGKTAPRFGELIVVRPDCCKYSIRLGSQTRSSGKVIRDSASFHQRLRTLDEPVVAACLQHWVDGLSWQETGLIDSLFEKVKNFGIYDGCRSMADILARYARLDSVYEVVSREQRLRSRAELDPPGWREMNGILVHIGKDGDLYFGGNGNHRLAMALALELDVIPAQLGAVHIDALGFLDQLRPAASDKTYV